MILDTLNNFEKYVATNPRLQLVADFIKSHNLKEVENGIIKIDGDDVFANFTTAKGKTPDEAKLETHNVMLDVQIPMSCSETMGYTPRASLEEQPYNEEKDITFYPGLAEQYITVHPGEFVVFFPQDGHAPCISNEKEIDKVIFKVKM